MTYSQIDLLSVIQRALYAHRAPKPILIICMWLPLSLVICSTWFHCSNNLNNRFDLCAIGINCERMDERARARVCCMCTPKHNDKLYSIRKYFISFFLSFSFAQNHLASWLQLHFIKCEISQWKLSISSVLSPIDNCAYLDNNRARQKKPFMIIGLKKKKTKKR